MDLQYSHPIEVLTHDPANGPVKPGSTLDNVDVVIVGSGYGACVAAERLAGLTCDHGPIRILVLERGNEYQPGSFPTTQDELPGHVRIQRPGKLKPTGYPDALFEIRNGDDLDILVANGLGGGSLINASVAAMPSRPLQAPWPALHHDLTAEYDAIRLLLNAQESAGALHAKYQAFKTVCDWTGFLAKPASITVTRTHDGTPRMNSVGIGQASCTDCGNCMTGCNVGAKNTLAMNLIPLAQDKGVVFLTGANVLSVEPSNAGPRWQVRVCRTRTIGTELEGDHYFIAADIVILGAGALGSTEILQRSKSPDLRLSDELGKHFSANGDGIAMGFAQSNRVNAIGVENYVNPQANSPGPTITGIAQGWVTHQGQEYAVTVEDGAIPVALTNLFGELATTGATIGRLGNPRLPAKLRSRSEDPLAFNRDVLDHSQLLLFMGDDGANRLLELHSPNVNFGDERDLKRWGSAAFPTALDDEARNDRANAPLRGMNARLVGRDRGPAFGDGQFVTNPLWQILPENARQAMSGRFPRERNLSVHPLGGCAMGDDVSKGVVNDRGNVFHADGGLHDGLYVMDGAIFPEPVGTNPFFTIAAVARRCANALRDDLVRNGWELTADSERTCVRQRVPAHTPTLTARDGRPATILLREQLVGQLREGEWDRASLGTAGGQDGWFQSDGLILRIKTHSFDPRTFFVDPDASLPFELTILTKRIAAHEIDEVADCWARFNGNVQLLHLDYPWYTTCQRAAAALCAYLRRRGGWRAFRGPTRPRQRGNSGAGGNLFKMVQGFCNAAKMHANYREFVYVVDSDAQQGVRGDAPPYHLKFTAKKQLRWRNDARRLWDALLNLDVENFELTVSGQRHTGPVRLQVDATYMLDEGLLQVDDSRSSVDSMSAVASFLAFFARSIFQTSFWEFGSHKYPEKKPHRDLKVPAIASNNGIIEPVRFRIDIPPRRGGDTIPLELHRYPRADATPVLLVHGLAQGSRIYTSPEQRPNLASFLYSEGYDVWVVDYRLSNRFERAKLPFDKAAWSIDEIGTEDMCVAVQTVYAKTGSPIHVFAHCVGAMGIQIGILRGLFNDGGKDMLASVCFNAIHPWIMPSAANRARSKLATFAKDWFPDSLLQPIPDTVENTFAALSLFDRLTFSLARIAERPNQEHANNTIDDLTSAICDRMTGLYGRMWCHENVRALHHQWLHIVGEAPGSVYRQLYYVIDKERLTDNNGENTHLIEPNILANWSRLPTLFMHGERSNVFNPQSATRSAVRLRRVLTGALTQDSSPPVYLKRIPGYGHMDPILADKAGETTFHLIRDFFRTAAAWHANPTVALEFKSDDICDAHDPLAHAIETPWTGPVLRGAWRHSKVVQTRWWVELFPDNTSLYKPGTTVINGRARPSFSPRGVAERFRWVDTDLAEGEELPTLAGATQRSGTAAIPIGKSTKPLIEPPRDALPNDFGAEDLRERPNKLPDSDKEKEKQTDHPLESKIDATAQMPWMSRMRRRMAEEPNKLKHAFNFLVGSCRYPGTPMERDRSDVVFKGMYREAVERYRTESNSDVAEGVDALFFVGDQIYSDAYTDAFDASQWRDRYYGQYRNAFNSPNAKKLLASVPTHFAIDDHELVDNWSGGKLMIDHAVPGDDNPLPPPAYFSEGQFNFAMQAARSYMSSARGRQPIGPLQPPDDALWYALDHGTEVDFPCFVMDTRSEREIRIGVGASMISDVQLKNFDIWLAGLAPDMKHKPKFVFAGQILAPIHRWTHDKPALWINEDGFVGYPMSLDAIIRIIVESGHHNIIFVGGDLHMSSVSRLDLCCGDKKVDAWQIVASGLYAPLLFANAQSAEYRWNQWLDWRCTGNGTSFRYRSHWLSSAESHFLKVLADKTAECWRVRVRVYDRDGKVMSVVPTVDEIGSTCRLQTE